jgi:DNA-binding transcriptional ArsR family regulator
MARKRKTSTRPRTLHIRDAATVRALRTPARQEILGALERLGAASVKDVAGELGRTPASLYYHVHELRKAGLIREAGTRPAGRRTEAIYEPAAERIVIDRSVTSKGFVEALSDLHSSVMRAADRELAEALEPARARKVPPGKSVALLRLSARLKPADARAARRKLQEVAEFLTRHDDPAADATFSFTGALVRLTPPEERRRP